MDILFKGIFDTAASSVSITVPKFLLCIFVALLVGVFLAIVFTYKTHYTSSFIITLAILPAIVAVVIMMVNGNIGAGVAVAGAFSLVRFRSVPGTAKEIGSLFLSMGTGLIIGMGYLGYAVLFAVVIGLAMLLLDIATFRTKHMGNREKSLRITIPEDLNYSDVFDDLFEKYTNQHDCVSVKTANMGSLFKLDYRILLKDPKQEKEFIDALRCRNGNLEISISRAEITQFEL